MNVAMVVYSHYSRDARVRKYAELLAGKNHQIDIICLKEDYLPKQKNIKLIHYPLERRRFNKFWYFLEYPLFFLFSFFYLTLLHIKKRYRVIHIHNMPDFLVFSALMPKLLGAKVILDMHDPMPELYMSKYGVNKNAFIVKTIKLIEGIAFRFANSLITANYNFQKIFIQRHPLIKNRINVIRNFPDEKIFAIHKKKLQEKDFILLYMGTIEERYNLIPAIKTIPILIKRIPSLKFNIYPRIKTEGSYQMMIKEKISQLGISDYVKILPPIPVEKLADKIAKSSVGILLLKKDVFTENIVPVKLLEFMKMGVPVIATKTKSLSETFPQNALYYINNNSPKNITTAVLDIYRNKKLNESLVKNAKKYLKNNNWQKESKKYLKLINQTFTN